VGCQARQGTSYKRAISSLAGEGLFFAVKYF